MVPELGHSVPGRNLTNLPFRAKYSVWGNTSARGARSLICTCNAAPGRSTVLALAFFLHKTDNEAVCVTGDTYNMEPSSVEEDTVLSEEEVAALAPIDFVTLGMFIIGMTSRHANSYSDLTWISR